MARNLVICCDGTANEFKKDRTNVLKLAFAAVKDREDQLVYYHPGVGTMAPPGLFTGIGKWVARLAGKAFGYGLENDIRDIYTYIINNYRPGDDLYIFGFSRGAYTARAVTALLEGYGLLAPGNDALVPYAIRLLWRYNETTDADAKAAWFKLTREFKGALSSGDCVVRFLGLWDTVSSVGWFANPLSLPWTHKLPNVRTVRHAVAIDERRAFFRTNLVELDPARDVQEVWFPGVHCDVGGGYPEEESQLSKIPLQWMIDQARRAGMRFDPSRVELVLGRKDGEYVAADPTAPMHKSMSPYWWPAEFVLKKHWNQITRRSEWKPNLFRRRHFSITPCIDDSAWARGAEYLARLPTDRIKRSDLERSK